ncbi:MAG: Uma2 family endonuclease [Planctomycetaceae bacterium]
MTTATGTRVTPEEYLALERKAEFRNEYRNGEIVPMTGGTREHNLLETNLIAQLHQQLSSKDYEVYPGNMRIKVDETGLYTYPDVAVVRGEPQLEDDEFDTLLNPVVLFEILSKSTESYDRGDKFSQYRTVPTFVEYLLISQTRMRIERFTRQPDGPWLFQEYLKPDDVVPLDAIECRLSVGDVYHKVPLDSPRS